MCTYGAKHMFNPYILYGRNSDQCCRHRFPLWNSSFQRAAERKALAERADFILYQDTWWVMLFSLYWVKILHLASVKPVNNMAGSGALRAKGADWRLQITPGWECVCLEWRPVRGGFLQKWLEPQTILSQPLGSPLTRLLDFTANELGTSGRFRETAADRDVDGDVEAMLAKAEVLFLLFYRICKTKKKIKKIKKAT